MFQRTLPTLKFDDYDKVAKELQLLTYKGTQRLLGLIGSNKHLSYHSILVATGSNDQQSILMIDGILDKLTMMGVLICKESFTQAGEDRFDKQNYYRVNWKQIRRINKAISLL